MSKTISVEKLRDMVNSSNRNGTQTALERQGQNSLLEAVLVATDNYRGFGYLGKHEVPRGELAGVLSNGEVKSFPDESRRIYY